MSFIISFKAWKETINQKARRGVSLHQKKQWHAYYNHIRELKLIFIKKKGGNMHEKSRACSSLAFLCEGAFWTYDEPISNLWSPSAVAWTWAAYCRFQSTSSMEGLADDCGDKHLFIMEITIDRDSWEQVLKMIGSMMPFLSSWLLSDLSYGTETKETCQCSRS